MGVLSGPTERGVEELRQPLEAVDAGQHEKNYGQS